MTNSIRIAECLMDRKIRCNLTGGVLVENSYAPVGNVAEETIRSMYADICFFSSRGITENGIITDYSEEETCLRECMIPNAQKSVFLYDRTELGKRFLFRLCTTDTLFKTICDG